jgi:hypothetical protein
MIPEIFPIQIGKNNGILAFEEGDIIELKNHFDASTLKV